MDFMHILGQKERSHLEHHFQYFWATAGPPKRRRARKTFPPFPPLDGPAFRFICSTYELLPIKSFSVLNRNRLTADKQAKCINCCFTVLHYRSVESMDWFSQIYYITYDVVLIAEATTEINICYGHYYKACMVLQKSCTKWLFHI